MGCSCRKFVEEQSLLFSVRLACRRVRICTDREQPRRKIVRRRQVTRTSRPHSKKWRALGCYLPSKRSGWTGRKRRERAKRPADPDSVRLDPVLRRQLEDAARSSFRPLSREIAFRLAESLKPSDRGRR
jgi:hypothetical protein